MIAQRIPLARSGVPPSYLYRNVPRAVIVSDIAWLRAALRSKRYHYATNWFFSACVNKLLEELTYRPPEHRLDPCPPVDSEGGEL